MADRQPIAWVTKGGKHIPIFDEGPSDDEKKKEREISENKKQADAKEQESSKKLEPIDRQISDIRFWAADIPDGMHDFEISTEKGKTTLSTNYGSQKYPKWHGGPSIQRDWDKSYTISSTFTVRRVFEDAVDKGFDELKFWELPTSVRGFHNVYVSARKRKE